METLINSKKVKSAIARYNEKDYNDELNVLLVAKRMGLSRSGWYKKLATTGFSKEQLKQLCGILRTNKRGLV